MIVAPVLIRVQLALISAPQFLPQISVIRYNDTIVPPRC
ncbi:hypothetical protein HMSP1_80 [Sinorhizobium phage HMSP1-Susan]|nr:hypothetical protein HMSP1_80 [Sinorhizobium phage HMSP1-Susan]